MSSTAGQVAADVAVAASSPAPSLEPEPRAHTPAPMPELGTSPEPCSAAAARALLFKAFDVVRENLHVSDTVRRSMVDLCFWTRLSLADNILAPPTPAEGNRQTVLVSLQG